MILVSKPYRVSAGSYVFCSNLNTKSSYASATQTAALLRSSVQYRRNRTVAADMITTSEAAELSGTSRVMISLDQKRALHWCVQSAAPWLQVAALA